MLLFLLGMAWAGGGPQNVLVLYNADVPEAQAVAEHYEGARDLPAGHLCGIMGIAEDETWLSLADYKAWVLTPLEDCLSSLPHPEAIDYLVVVRGLPYQVEAGDYTVSLSAALQVSRLPSQSGGDGLLIDDGHPDGYAYVQNPYYMIGSTTDFDLSNDYAAWYTSASGITRTRRQPQAFARSLLPAEFGDHLFIVTRLDGFDYQDATDVVDRGVASDGTFPDAPFLCMHGADGARGARDPECEFTTRKLAALGREAVWVSAFDSTLSGHTVSAYFTGAADVRDGIAGLKYVPGAISCNLTSYGAVPGNFFCDDSGEVCPASESQTSVARYIRAGATGAHGTVNEPYNNVFPNAGTMLHYAMGYSLGESYFFNQLYLYWQNLVIGDPLATPFAERPVVSFSADRLSLGTPLVVSAAHPDGIHTLRLYVDDVMVASSDSDTLSWLPEAEAGEVLQLRAVAEVADVARAVADWPQDEILVRHRTQGWSLTALSLTAADADTGAVDTGESDAPDTAGKDAGGCGGRALIGVWAVGLAVGAARRRRGAPPSA